MLNEVMRHITNRPLTGYTYDTKAWYEGEDIFIVTARSASPYFDFCKWDGNNFTTLSIPSFISAANYTVHVWDSSTSKMILTRGNDGVVLLEWDGVDLIVKDDVALEGVPNSINHWIENGNVFIMVSHASSPFFSLLQWDGNDLTRITTYNMGSDSRANNYWEDGANKLLIIGRNTATEEDRGVLLLRWNGTTFSLLDEYNDIQFRYNSKLLTWHDNGINYFILQYANATGFIYFEVFKIVNDTIVFVKKHTIVESTQSPVLLGGTLCPRPDGGVYGLFAFGMGVIRMRVRIYQFRNEKDVLVDERGDRDRPTNINVLLDNDNLGMFVFVNRYSARGIDIYRFEFPRKAPFILPTPYSTNIRLDVIESYRGHGIWKEGFSLPPIDKGQGPGIHYNNKIYFLNNDNGDSFLIYDLDYDDWSLSATFDTTQIKVVGIVENNGIIWGRTSRQNALDPHYLYNGLMAYHIDTDTWSGPYLNSWGTADGLVTTFGNWSPAYYSGKVYVPVRWWSDVETAHMKLLSYDISSDIWSNDLALYMDTTSTYGNPTTVDNNIYMFNTLASPYDSTVYNVINNSWITRPAPDQRTSGQSAVINKNIFRKVPSATRVREIVRWHPIATAWSSLGPHTLDDSEFMSILHSGLIYADGYLWAQYYVSPGNSQPLVRHSIKIFEEE